MQVSWGRRFGAVERFVLRHIHLVVATSTASNASIFRRGAPGRTVLLENTVFPFPEDSDEGVRVPPGAPGGSTGLARFVVRSRGNCSAIGSQLFDEVELVLAGPRKMAENERFLDEVAKTSSTVSRAV